MQKKKPPSKKPAAKSKTGGHAPASADKPRDGNVPPAALPPLIVGIGASAGGLEAYKHFFSHMPADSAMAFVLVQHLAPHHTSLLAELVGRSTRMPVLEAADGEDVQPGHVYVIPPDATLTIADGTLQLSKPAPPRAHRWPIDTFFMSLAEDQGDCAVSIVLSGSGSDGARGLRAVKEHGGLTLAQAGFDHVAMSGMPASAAATGLVDDVLPVEEMPARLLAHQQHLVAMRAQSGPDGTREDVPAHLAEIMRLLHADSGHDFGQYKEKTLVRRIQRRMQVLRKRSAADYVQHLREEPAELEHLFRELLISVTSFFRDPAAFELLTDRVIPALLAGKTAADTLRVWVPGCATGEEAYSIAIALMEVMGTSHGKPRVQIFATDIDDRAIGAARAGRFRAPLAGVSAERLERWFQSDGEDFVVAKAVREMCIFSPHSAIKDPPFTRLDLVSCRNLLIYLNAQLQERLVRTFHYALQPGGYLLLGPSEGVSRNAKLFSVIDKKHRLYQRREDGNVRLPVLPARPEPHATRHPGTHARGEDLLERSVRRALERHVPAYVVIDAQSDVLRFSGDTGRYLQPSSGAASLNLFTLLHKGLRGGARSAVQEALAQRRPAVRNGLSITVDGQSRALRIIVEPLTDIDGGQSLCVVAFRESETAPAAAADAGSGAGPGHTHALHTHGLEQELASLRLQLQNALDQQETVNEELKSANEEYQSVNEELQSSNEELETSKEEMQSINEELQIVNAELHGKNTALQRANSDLRNLMDSTRIATLFLDAQLRVTGFTPVITELFHLRQGDIGRPITEISSRIPYPDLEQDVREVTESLAMTERLLHGDAADGPIYMLRMRPYRTVDNVIDGVVLTFTDITDRRRMEIERGQLAAIVDSSNDIIIGHALDGTITSWNASAERILGHPAARMIDKSLALLLPQGSPQLQALLDTRVRRGPSEFETRWLRRDGSEVDVSVIASPVHDSAGNVVAGSLIARDIGERLHAERALASGARRAQQLLEQATVGIAEADAEGRYLLANPAYCQIVGRDIETLLQLRKQDITHPDDAAENLARFRRLVAGGPPYRIEKRYLRPDGSAVWADSSVSLIDGLDGEPSRVLMVSQDISERRRTAEHRELMLAELNHRVKNTLASVQSIALQTIAGTSSSEAFRQTFMARLQALSNTHNLLAADAWNGVGLREIVLGELAPYKRDGEARIDLACDDLQLSAKTALALGMAVHELTTNAVKYGALSVPQGRLAVRCTAHRANGTARLLLEWRERDGPPVSPPTRRGFGSRLIADGLAFELDGSVSLEFDPAGVVCTIDVPLSETPA